MINDIGGCEEMKIVKKRGSRKSRDERREEVGEQVRRSN